MSKKSPNSEPDQTGGGVDFEHFMFASEILNSSSKIFVSVRKIEIFESKTHNRSGNIII